MAPRVASDVDLEFATDGQRHRRALQRSATIRFESDCRPVRKFPCFRGQRNYPGLWWFATTGQHVGHESWLERDHLMLLDADPDVIGVASQPFRFCWGDGSCHVPDFFARTADGLAVVFDVRADNRIDAADEEVFAKSEITCRSVGWEYRRVGMIDPVRLANVRWLSGYRHPRVCRIGIAEELLGVFSHPRPLLTGVGLVGDPVHVLPVLFHLLWHQRLAVDLLRAPLSEMTVVSPVRIR
ncbi:hypothetical protein C1Y40_00628 [Mycobacterium talmoniae]|uniref:Transposase n=1 Tax=Mycobacterium talmoniae TaxID=1858794 RepID=A0A2S8BRB0_9MYCO|nr:hypothetical protein C1Y40_00628 [Mycobacterium talmoniae]